MKAKPATARAKRRMPVLETAKLPGFPNTRQAREVVRGMLEGVLADHVKVAAELRRLLPQIDEPSTSAYLLQKFADAVDYDPHLEWQISAASDYLFSERYLDYYGGSLDQFLDFEVNRIIEFCASEKYRRWEKEDRTAEAAYERATASRQIEIDELERQRHRFDSYHWEER